MGSGRNMPSLGATNPSADVPPGTAVGEYRIERKIGRGGMGGVYQAIHPVIGKRVALKVLHHELCEDQGAVGRFVQEARAVNRIGHRNIVDVFGFGTTGDGRAYLAMELLAGETLAERMDRDPPVDREQACDILAEVTNALEAAHRAGIVHRDLKPDNIFLVEGGRTGIDLKLLDFGIAKLTSLGGFDQPVDCTQPGTLIGTPQYMAPEQARGLMIDGAADVYALGVVAFELLVGRPPFTSTDPVELLAKHITLKPPAPTELNPALPQLADIMIGAMLEKDPSARPSLLEVRMQLVALRTAKASSAASALARSRQQATEILDAVDDEPRRRRRWWIPLVGLGVAAIGVKLAMTIADRTDDDAPPPSAVQAAPAPAPVVAPPPVETSPPPVAPAPVESATPDETSIESATPDEASIEMPVEPVAKKRPLVKKQPRKPKTEAKPPAVVTPPIAPQPTPPSPKPPADDDALRDPFQRNK